MKRSLALVCTVALLLRMIVPGVSAEGTTCPCCGAENVTWITMTDNMDMEPGHYRLEKDTKQKKTLSTAGTYCIDLAGYTQEECAEQMGIARTTVQGIYNDARQKLADALVNGKTLYIEGGDVDLCQRQDAGCGRKCGQFCCKKDEI